MDDAAVDAESTAGGVNPQRSINAHKERQEEASASQASVLETCAEERHLIALVSLNPALYDGRHPRFRDDDHKEQLWQRIAGRLNVELTQCLSTWSELRYRYQRHVRRQRAFHRSSVQQRGRMSSVRRRPLLRHEEELLFLYPHVARFPLQMPDATPAKAEGEGVGAVEAPHDEEAVEVEFVEPPPVDIIDVDLVEETSVFRCTRLQRRLIEAVSAYPQLYDTQHPQYTNFRHRGLIWGSISNEMRDKATKLIKCWLTLQTRYEWEVTHCNLPGSESELRQLMAFLRPHVLRMRRTVCQASKYLQNGWHEPIDRFRSVLILINTMRTMPDHVDLVDGSLTYRVKPARYDDHWLKVDKTVGLGHQRCEVTWLLLRSFYNELLAMRQAGYQLQDKWYFENVFRSIVRQATTRAAARPANNKRPSNGDAAGEAAAKIAPTPAEPPRLPMAIVYPPSMKNCNIHAIISGSGSGSTSGTISATRSSGTATSITSATKSINASIASEPPVPSFVIPTISGAVRLSAITRPAGQPSNPIKILPKPVPASSVVISSGTNQTTNALRSMAQRPGLQISVRQTAVRIRPVAPPNQHLSAAPGSVNVQRYSPPTSTTLGAAPAPAPPAAAAPPPPQPKTVTRITSNAGASTSGEPAAAPPMVRIHQPTLHNAWDATGSSVSGIKFTVLPAKAGAATSAGGVGVGTAGGAGVEVAAGKAGVGAAGGVGGVAAAGGAAAAGRAGIEAAGRAGVGAAGGVGVGAAAGVAAAGVAAAERAGVAPVGGAGVAASGSVIVNPQNTSPGRRAPVAIAPKIIRAVPPPMVVPSPAIYRVEMPAEATTTETPDSFTSVSQPMHPDFPCSPRGIFINAINVNLVHTSSVGKSLHIWGGGLNCSYHLNMMRTATLIREVMAVPQLHHKDPQLKTQCDGFWHTISQKFILPEVALRACWNFLANNISIFPMIAPMSELMRPFKGTMKVWEKSNRLFGKFDEIAVKYDWMKHKDVMPDLIRHFRKHEHLFWEMRKPRPGEPIPTPPQYTERERQEVWREAKILFPDLNHLDIWSMFKFAFRTYMEDLERGIENPWPQNWWQALEQLKFLADLRYHPLEPYYYIIHNKILEEVKRCSMFDALTSSEDNTPAVLARISKEPMPWCSEEAKRMLTGQFNFSANMDNDSEATEEALETATVLATGEDAPRVNTDEPEAGPELQPESQTQLPREPEPEPEPEPELQREPEPEPEPEPSVRRKVVRRKNRASYPLPTIEAFELTRMLRRYPNTFMRSHTINKRTAWVRVSKELNITVTECRLSLQHAVREMRILKTADIANFCTMGHKYYRHMDEIYKQVKKRSQLTVRTPQQVNQSVSEPAEVVVPEQFVPEINMSTCSPGLVLKNWAYAVGNLSSESQDILAIKLKHLFAKYAKNTSHAQEGDISLSTQIS